MPIKNRSLPFINFHGTSLSPKQLWKKKKNHTTLEFLLPIQREISGPEMLSDLLKVTQLMKTNLRAECMALTYLLIPLSSAASLLLNRLWGGMFLE